MGLLGNFVKLLGGMAALAGLTGLSQMHARLLGGAYVLHRMLFRGHYCNVAEC